MLRRVPDSGNRLFGAAAGNGVSGSCGCVEVAAA